MKSVLLGYTEESVDSSARLNSVTDPRSAETRVEYYTSTENSTDALWPKRYSDRRGDDITFGYADPDASAAKDGGWRCGSLSTGSHDHPGAGGRRRGPCP